MPGKVGHDQSLLAEHSTKLDNIIQLIEKIGHQLDELHEAMYRPDDGVFARIQQHDAQLKTLTDWQAKTATRFRWVIGLLCGGLSGGGIKFIIDLLSAHH